MEHRGYSPAFHIPTIGFAHASVEITGEPSVRTRWANHVLLALFMAFGLFMLARDMIGR